MSLWDHVEKYCKVGQATDEGYLRQQTHTLTVCNIYCFSIATMVARSRLTLYVIHTLPALLLAHFICSAKSAHVFIYSVSKTDFYTRTGLRRYEMIAAVFIIKTYLNLKYFFTQYAYCAVIPFWNVLLWTVMHFATSTCTCFLHVRANCGVTELWHHS
jgi:hypothetical protein